LSKASTSQPVNRQGFWCLLRRVPKAYAALEHRKTVKISTGIRVAHDPRGVLARQKVRSLNDKLETYWKTLASGDNTAAALATLAAARTASQLELEVLTQSQALEKGLAAFLTTLKNITQGKRLEQALLEAPGSVLSNAMLAAGIPDDASPKDENCLRVSQMIEEVERINATLLAKKSPAQRKRWKIHCQTNLDILLNSIDGDPLVKDLTTKHTRAFRGHYQKRALDGAIAINIVVYDLGVIRDDVEFRHDLEKGPSTVIVIKH